MPKRVRGGRPGPKRAPRRPSKGAAGAIRRAPDLFVSPQPAAAAEPIEPIRMLDDEGPDEGLDELPKATSAHLTESELHTAESLQEELIAREKAALADQIRRKSRARAPEADLGDVNAPLRVRASHEYAYVARDVRRIIITGGIMVVILAVLAILINGFGVISI